ncbi:hypothetical protein F511_00097 [Dorcoceras hygrometricum]|nr:hypothetical protein F511_00097 [Dorcoceras hygrometricum]
MHAAVVLASDKNAANDGNNLDGEKSLISHPLGKKHPTNDMHDVVTNTMVMNLATQRNNLANGDRGNSVHNQQSLLVSVSSNKGREMEDPATKAYI